MSPDDGVPILFSKIDLKDGYWKMCVNEKYAWNFEYVLPKEKPEEEVYLVIPDALQMGWCESPAFFCVAKEIHSKTTTTTRHKYLNTQMNTQF